MKGKWNLVALSRVSMDDPNVTSGRLHFRSVAAAHVRGIRGSGRRLAQVTRSGGALA